MINCTKEDIIFESCKCGYIEFVQHYKDNGLKINYQTHHDGMTSLHWASYKNHLNVVKLLIEDDMSGIDLCDFCTGETALINASTSGNLEIVKYLVEKGANVHKIGFFGETALIAAMEENHTEIVDYLLKCGAITY